MITRGYRYPSKVRRIANGRALVKLAEWPDRFMEWIPFISGRLAPLGAMTAIDEKCVKLSAEPSMRQGTTANIALQTAVEIQQTDEQDSWLPAVVVGVSDDGD